MAVLAPGGGGGGFALLFFFISPLSPTTGEAEDGDFIVVFYWL